MKRHLSETKSPSTLPPDHRAFLDAVRTGNVDTVRELLTKGVPVDVREDFCLHYMQNEQTALMYAAAGGHLEIVRLLLRAGADVNARDKMMSPEDGGEKTALHYAATQPAAAVVEELLNAGADINALTKNAWNLGGTPLSFALGAGHRDVVQCLIARGANLSGKIGRKNAYSPLCAAIDAQRGGVASETIRDLFLLLLEAKADPNATGSANQTAVALLAGVDSTDTKSLPEDIANSLLEALLKAGAQPDAPDKFGTTPLDSALLRLNPGATRILLQAGADVNRVSARGTALDTNERDTAMWEKNLNTPLPPPADEKSATRQKQLRAVQEDRLRRCREIAQILHQFGAKRKTELPQLA
jgi:ankyrin repeat protein